MAYVHFYTLFNGDFTGYILPLIFQNAGARVEEKLSKIYSNKKNLLKYANSLVKLQKSSAKYIMQLQN